MPSLDIFNDDAFSLQSLTASIAEQPHVPGRMGQLGMFQNEGITTTQISIEKDGATLGLVAAADRGAPGQVVVGDKRTMIPFNTLHLPQTGAVMADEIQNVRAFGSETEVESVQTVVNRHLAKHRRQIDATLEHLMIGAAKGQLLDSDGSTVLVNLLTQFGINQTTHSLVLGTATTKVREKVLGLLDLIEDKLGGVSFTGVRVLCGRNYFKNLIGHDKVAPAWERWNNGEMLRNDPRGGFEFGGAIFEQYRGQVGGNKFIGDDEAYAIPEGVSELFIGRFAPANYLETVNTNGLPYYSKMQPLEFDTGMKLQSQSNPIFLCTRPGAVVKLTG
jgi:hypothetical protein